MTHHHIERPDCQQARSFQVTTCPDDDECGLHLIAYDDDDKPICEIVIGRTGLRGLLSMIHDAGLDL